MQGRAWRRSWRAGCVSFGFRAPFAGIRQAYGPILCLLGIDFEEAGAFEAALQAILHAANSEDLVDGAHRGFAGPLAAAVVVDRMHVVEPARQRAAEEGLAHARRDVPPPPPGPPPLTLLPHRPA